MSAESSFFVRHDSLREHSTRLIDPAGMTAFEALGLTAICGSVVVNAITSAHDIMFFTHALALASTGLRNSPGLDSVQLPLDLRTTMFGIGPQHGGATTTVAHI